MKPNRTVSWAMVVIWMGIIFLFSAQNGTQSGGLSGQIAQWLISVLFPRWAGYSPDRQEAIYATVHLLVRKGAHFGVYAVLGVLWYRVVSGYPRLSSRPWLLAWGLSALYAVTDELHQGLSPGRVMSGRDVAIDSAGAITGIGLWLLAGWLASRWRERDKA